MRFKTEGTVWLFGGETTTGSFFDDLWKLERDGSSWTWTEVKYRPKMTGRSGHCLIRIQFIPFTLIPSNI